MKHYNYKRGSYNNYGHWSAKHSRIYDKLVARTYALITQNDSESPKFLRKIRSLLKLWSKWNDTKGSYGYLDNFYSNLAYCSDRMNAGRARALLKIMPKSTK